MADIMSGQDVVLSSEEGCDVDLAHGEQVALHQRRFAELSQHCKPGDAVLLIEDGVYGALAGSSVAGAVADSLNDVTLYVLDGDVSARASMPPRF